MYYANIFNKGVGSDFSVMSASEWVDMLYSTTCYHVLVGNIDYMFLTSFRRLRIHYPTHKKTGQLKNQKVIIHTPFHSCVVLLLFF